MKPAVVNVLLSILMSTMCGLIGCDISEECGNPGTTKCDDNKVWYCTSSHEWIVETNCHTVIMLNGNQYPGQCCNGYGLAFCAEECGVSDAGKGDASW